MIDPAFTYLSTDPPAKARQPLSVPFLHDCATKKDNLMRILATLGPGIMVCLADTDGPGLVTAAQSGVEFKYALLLFQFLLTPILYCAQDMTVRLALVRGKGVVALVKEEINDFVAWIVAISLLLTCAVGLLSEYIVIGQVMLFWNISVPISAAIITLFLVSIVLTGSYHVAERVGLTMGACQVLFMVTMFWAGPKPSEVWDGLGTFYWNDAPYLRLVTANIGAVIMPWMLAYQQSAICQKGLYSNGGAKEHLFLEQMDTLIGSLITQGVMSAILVTAAAARGTRGQVQKVHDLLAMFTVIVGSELGAKLLLSFAIIGASMIAAIVETLCAAWVFEEAMGRAPDPREVQNTVCARLRERPVYYGTFILVCVGAFLFTVFSSNVVFLSVGAEVVNGILMPPVVFALWYLCSYKLPEEYRLGTTYKRVLFFLLLISSVFCLASIPIAFTGTKGK